MVETHLPAFREDETPLIRSALAYPSSTPHLNPFGLSICDLGKNSGRGIYATRALPSNTVIEISPVLLFPPREYEEYGSKTQLDGYTFVWKRVEAGRSIMALALGLGSLFNHSRTPNVSYTLNHPRHCIIYTTTKEIAEGEELCISYGSGRMWWEKPTEEELSRETQERSAAQDPDAELLRMSGMDLSDEESPEAGEDIGVAREVRKVENGIELHSTPGPSVSKMVDYSRYPPMYRLTSAKDPRTVPLETRSAWVVEIAPRSASAAIKFLQKHPETLQNRDDGLYCTRHLRSFKTVPGPPPTIKFLICLEEAIPSRKELISLLLQADGVFGDDPNPYQIQVPRTAAPTKERLQEWQDVWPCIVRSGSNNPLTGRLELGAGTVGIVDRKADEEMWEEEVTGRFRWAVNRFKRVVALARHAKSQACGKDGNGAIPNAVHVTHPYEQARAFVATEDRQDAPTTEITWDEREKNADWSCLQGASAPIVGRISRSQPLEAEKEDVIKSLDMSDSEWQAFSASRSAYYASPIPGVGTIEVDSIDRRISKRNPLKHASIEAVARVSILRAIDRTSEALSSPTTNGSSDIASTAVANGADYLLTGLSLFTLYEPCIYCTMALLHSRVKEIYFLLPSPGRGGCCGAQLTSNAQCEGGQDGGIYALQEQKGLNHSFVVWRWMRSRLATHPGDSDDADTLEDLMEEFDIGTLDP